LVLELKKKKKILWLKVRHRCTQSCYEKCTLQCACTK